MAPQSSTGDETPHEFEKALQPPRPDWADGLRQLYDSVVDEPLPDAFRDLLERLDGGDANTGDDGIDGSHGGRG